MLINAETGKDLYCEICDLKSSLRDALQMESHYKQRLSAAEARVKELEQENASLREQIERRWIPVSDRLSEKLTSVLIAYTLSKKQWVGTAHLHNGEWKWSTDGETIARPTAITHWQPLPAPPAEKESK
jgi:hypothetical protein